MNNEYIKSMRKFASVFDNIDEYPKSDFVSEIPIIKNENCNQELFRYYPIIDNKNVQTTGEK